MAKKPIATASLKPSGLSDWWAVLKIVKQLILAVVGPEAVEAFWLKLEAKAQETSSPWDDRIVDGLKAAWDRL